MKTSWYKEPWAWFIFFLPFSAVVAGIATYIIANHEPDALVIGEYYKKGKAINLELSKIKQAQKLGIAFDLRLKDNKLLIKYTGISQELPVLNIKFYHPTQEKKDFNLTLTPDGNGDFRHYFDKVIQGKWRITLTPFENHWKIENTVYLPQENFIKIKPDLTQAN